MKVLLSVACTIVIIGGMKLAASLLIPIVLALFLALLSLPVTRWLTRHHVPQPMAVLLTVGLDILVLVSVVNMTRNLANEFAKDVFVYANRLQTKAEHYDERLDRFFKERSFGLNQDEDESENGDESGENEGDKDRGQAGSEGDATQVPDGTPPDPGVGSEGESEEQSEADSINAVLAERGITPGGEREEEVAKIAEMSREEFLEYLKEMGVVGSESLAGVRSQPDKRVRFLSEIFAPSAEAVLASMQSVVKSAASLLSATFFVGLVMVFILAEVSSRGDTIEAIRAARGPDLSKFQSATQDVQKYLAIKTLISAATGLLAWILTSAMGLDAAPLWGMVAFALNYIPAIGSIIAAIPPVLVAVVQDDLGLWHSAGIAAGYLMINVALGNFVEPMLLGKRFGISTLVVILSVIFWRWMWGPVGMFLAVPLTMIVMVMLENSKDFRWLAVAMGKKSARGPMPSRIRRRLQKRREESHAKAGNVPLPESATASGENATEASS